jgi:glycosyltransferase involved in cell wall biosynthesis
VKHAKAVMTVSLCLAKGMQERYQLKNKNYQVVYNCVDTQVFAEKNTLPHRKVKELLYVAELDDVSKNVSGLLQVVAALYAKRKDFILYVVGYGKDEEMLKTLAKQLDIHNKAVFFKGKFKAKEVAAILQQTDALLMFSHFETLSCIITESLCCGTPVISTAVGGVVEIVTPQNGLLVSDADQHAMQLAIERLLDEEVVFDSKGIALSAQDLFSNQAVGQKLITVYKQVLLC